MIDTQKIKQKAQIEHFKNKFYREHNVKLYVLAPTSFKAQVDLEIYKKITLECVVKDHPKYIDYDFETKTKERDFITYIQVMSFMAHNDRYSKTAIAISIFRNHATVINSCKMISNAIETKNADVLRIIKEIKLKINLYVGTISNNTQRKFDTKPVSDPIWDEARRFINS